MNFLTLLFAAAALVSGGHHIAHFNGPPGSETYGERFCELTQVLPARHRPVRLAVERAVVERGGTVYGRIENRSDSGVGFGVFYEVERRTGRSWHRVPGAGVRHGYMIGLLLGPGQAGYCMRYRVPPDAPAGLYRFTRDIETFPAPRERTYAIPFAVAP